MCVLQESAAGEMIIKTNKQKATARTINHHVLFEKRILLVLFKQEDKKMTKIPTNFVRG